MSADENITQPDHESNLISQYCHLSDERYAIALNQALANIIRHIFQVADPEKTIFDFTSVIKLFLQQGISKNDILYLINEAVVQFINLLEKRKIRFDLRATAVLFVLVS